MIWSSDCKKWAHGLFGFGYSLSPNFTGKGVLGAGSTKEVKAFRKMEKSLCHVNWGHIGWSKNWRSLKMVRVEIFLENHDCVYSRCTQVWKCPASLHPLPYPTSVHSQGWRLSKECATRGCQLNSRRWGVSDGLWGHWVAHRLSHTQGPLTHYAPSIKEVTRAPGLLDWIQSLSDRTESTQMNFLNMHKLCGFLFCYLQVFYFTSNYQTIKKC